MEPRLIEKLQNSIKKFDDCYEKIEETYCDGVVEGFTSEMLLGKDCCLERSMLNSYSRHVHTRSWCYVFWGSE